MQEPMHTNNPVLGIGCDLTLDYPSQITKMGNATRVAPLLDSILPGRPRYRQPQDNRLRGG